MTARPFMAARRQAIRTIPSTTRWRGREVSRHSGAMRSIEPGISRFRVWSFGPSRNDGGWIEAAMFDEDELPKKKSKAISPGKPAAGKCLCGKIAFEIDVPARWAGHDHSAASRRAHGAAYATYVGSWRKRFRITRGKAALARYEDGATKTTRSFCSSCGTPVMYE